MLVITMILFIIWINLIIIDIIRVKQGKNPILYISSIEDTSTSNKHITFNCLGYKIDCIIDYSEIVSTLIIRNIKILMVQYDIRY